jgi:hypothetical protein
MSREGVQEMGTFERSADGECTCGRSDGTVRVVKYRSHTGEFRFHRCECGTEWTERLARVDRTQPVTSDELLDVHILLADFDGKITDLVERRATS